LDLLNQFLKNESVLSRSILSRALGVSTKTIQKDTLFLQDINLQSQGAAFTRRRTKAVPQGLSDSTPPATGRGQVFGQAPSYRTRGVFRLPRVHLQLSCLKILQSPSPVGETASAVYDLLSSPNLLDLTGERFRHCSQEYQSCR
jgi:hypothetical protein